MDLHIGFPRDCETCLCKPQHPIGSFSQMIMLVFTFNVSTVQHSVYFSILAQTLTIKQVTPYIHVRTPNSGTPSPGRSV